MRPKEVGRRRGADLGAVNVDDPQARQPPGRVRFHRQGAARVRLVNLGDAPLLVEACVVHEMGRAAGPSASASPTPTTSGTAGASGSRRSSSAGMTLDLDL